MSSIVGHFKRSWGPSGSHGALSSRLVRLWVGPALSGTMEFALVKQADMQTENTDETMLVT